MVQKSPPKIKISYQKYQYPNRLTLLVAPNSKTPTVSIAAFVNAGVLCEPENKAGLSYLVSLLVDEGTRKRKGAAIQEELESVGGVLDTGPRGASMRLPAEELGRGLRILSEILIEASFPESAVQKKRELLLSEILAEEDDPQSKAQLEFRELIYGKHPLHRPDHGYKRTVSRLRRTDVVDFYRKFYAPERTILAVAGDVRADQVERLVSKYFGRWNRRAAPIPHIAPMPSLQKSRVKILREEHQQVHIYLGHAGIRRNDPNYYRLLVLDHVLGAGPGFTDRLSKRLRDEQGLAYTVHASIASSAGQEPGLFSAYMGTSPDRFDLAVAGILQEIRKITQKPPSAEELRLAKDYLTGSYIFGLERNLSRAFFLISRERYGLGEDYLEKYPRLIEEVTSKDVLQVARQYISPQRYVLVAVGSVKKTGMRPQ